MLKCSSLWMNVVANPKFRKALFDTYMEENFIAKKLPIYTIYKRAPLSGKLKPLLWRSSSQHSTDSYEDY